MSQEWFHSTAQSLSAAEWQVVPTIKFLRGLSGWRRKGAAYVKGRLTAGDGGGGIFAWRDGDHSASAQSDPSSGIWVAPDADPTGASGAWERLFTSTLSVRWFGAAGDGTTDDAPAIQAALDFQHARGGGTVYLPSTPDYYRTLAPLVVRSRVWVRGDGPSTLIKNESTVETQIRNVFFMGNHHPAHFPSHTNYALNAASKNTYTLVATVPAEASNFSVGQVVLVRSQEVDANDNPFFLQMNRITSIDAGTGAITVHYPLEENVSNPQITDMSGFVDVPINNLESFIADRARISDLAVHTEFQFIDKASAFECVIDNIDIRKSRQIISGNAWAYCTLSNLRGFFTDRFIEIVSGTVRTDMHDIHGVCLQDHDPGGDPIIKFGEHALENTLRDWSCHAADHGGNFGIRHQARKNTVRDGVFTATSIGADVLRFEALEHIYSDTDTYSGNRVERVKFSVGSAVRYVLITAPGGAAPVPHDSWITDNQFLGTVTSQACFGQVGENNHIEGNYFEQGGFQANAEFLNNTVRRNSFESFVGDLSPLAGNDIAENVRRGAESYYRGHVRLNNQSVNSTVSTNQVAAYTVDAGVLVNPADVFRVEIHGAVAGGMTNGTKTIELRDNDGALATVTLAAPDTGPFKIFADIFVRSISELRSSVEVHAPVTGSDVIRTIRSGLDLQANGRVFEVRAWVADALDTITLDTVRIRPLVFGDSL